MNGIETLLGQWNLHSINMLMCVKRDIGVSHFRFGPTVHLCFRFSSRQLVSRITKPTALRSPCTRPQDGVSMVQLYRTELCKRPNDVRAVYFRRYHQGNTDVRHCDDCGTHATCCSPCWVLRVRCTEGVYSSLVWPIICHTATPWCHWLKSALYSSYDVIRLLHWQTSVVRCIFADEHVEHSAAPLNSGGIGFGG